MATLGTNESFRKQLPMSILTVAGRFVELCNQAKDLQVMETMYAPAIVSERTTYASDRTDILLLRERP